jgi:hypothetical protein
MRCLCTETILLIIIIIIIIIIFQFYGTSACFQAMASPYPGFRDNLIFTRWGCQPHAQPQTWRARVSPFLRHLTRNLSGMGVLTASMLQPA